MLATLGYHSTLMKVDQSRSAGHECMMLVYGPARLPVELKVMLAYTMMNIGCDLFSFLPACAESCT